MVLQGTQVTYAACFSSAGAGELLANKKGDIQSRADLIFGLCGGDI